MSTIDVETGDTCGPNCKCLLCNKDDFVVSSMIEMNEYPNDTSNTASLVVADFAVGGMTCSMCSDAVKRALMNLPGVETVSVSLATNLARVEFQESFACNTKVIQETIEDIGYDVDDVMVQQQQLSQLPPTKSRPTKKAIEVAVGGMTCSMCSSAVHSALEGIKGVESVTVSLATNTARVEYYESPQCNAEILTETIEDIGYDVNDVLVEKGQELSIAHEEAGRSGECLNNFDDIQGEVHSLTSSLGMDAEPEDRLGRVLKQQDRQLKARRRAFLWSFLGALPIFIITMVLPESLNPDGCVMQFLNKKIDVLGHSFVVEALLLWFLTTPVQFICGFSFYKTSYFGISRGILGMDVLVALGTTASYSYAVMATWTGDMGYHFFETSATLICFVLLGKWLNAMAVCRTSEALTHLMKLQAKTALKVTPSTKTDTEDWNPLERSYQEKTVPIQCVQPGDMVKVLKGASIPADGILMHGEMCVDESMITGESLPVLKTPGDVVLGGTICAETGSGSMEKPSSKELTAAAFVKVTGVGSSTALAQIVQLVQDAQTRQVPIQTLADSIAGIFVPSVVLISLVTFLVWYGCCIKGVVPPSWYVGESPATFSLLFGIACLVISCPCALGLATPTAVMVGTGVGARHGVLIKGGDTLEIASRVDAVIFDKTGTLTRGKPVVTDFMRVVPEANILEIMNSNGMHMDADDFLLWLLGSLERNSEHPLAHAIVSHAEKHLTGKLDHLSFLQPSSFTALTGRGASGIINGSIKVSAGNRAFAARENMKIIEEVEVYLCGLENEGKTAILVGINDTVCAVMGVADELKEEASESVLYLKEMGIDVWMVTGDSKRTADSIARKLNLPTDRVISEALPVSKVEQVRRLQSQGLLVAMVGDGVNDSPALAEADVGLSMGTGAEIAAEASDMVLVSGKVSDTCTALHLSRVIFRRIQLNLLFSLVYNLLSIPLAAGLFFPLLHTRLPPTLAAVAMALSSVSVVSSSLALRLYKPPDVSKLRTATRVRRPFRRGGPVARSESEQYTLVADEESAEIEIV